MIAGDLDIFSVAVTVRLLTRGLGFVSLPKDQDSILSRKHGMDFPIPYSTLQPSSHKFNAVLTELPRVPKITLIKKAYAEDLKWFLS